MERPEASPGGDGGGLPDREQALALLKEYTQKPGLIGHALAVEAAMRAYARRHGEDERAWGLVGLLHDFDYERYPTAEDHPYRGAEILEQRGYPEWFRKAVMSHAAYTGIPRETLLEKSLFACDELTGFLTACALVRPDRAISEVQVKSVSKKLKDKAFARGVNRDDVRRGSEELGVELGEHIAFVRDAMATIADRLELPPPAA